MNPESETTLLLGVVGSHAYGLATPDSDVDRLGTYAVPTARLHGLRPPIGRQATRSTHDPDVTLHEVGKLASLCLSCNPTTLELLWLDQYDAKTDLGARLVELRSSFLSARRVRDAYLGYVDQQFRRLARRGRFPDVPVARIEKHARHLLRLVEQGTHLWATGTLEVRTPDPVRVLDFGRRVGAGDLEAPGWVVGRARETFERVTTALPERPDEDAVERWLLDVRARYYRGRKS